MFGLATLTALHAVELFDVREEGTSRETLGGLSRKELSIHGAAFVTRTAAVGFLLLSLPAEAWQLSATTAVGSMPALLAGMNAAVLGGSIIIALVHVVLVVRHVPPGAGRRCCTWAAA